MLHLSCLRQTINNELIEPFGRLSKHLQAKDDWGKMKAVLCKEHGLPETLVMEEIDAPVPGKGEILLDVHSAAVNFPDYLIIQNKYQMKPELPFSPGSEVAGRVAALGEGVDGLKGRR